MGRACGARAGRKVDVGQRAKVIKSSFPEPAHPQEVCFRGSARIYAGVPRAGVRLTVKKKKIELPKHQPHPNPYRGTSLIRNALP